jgi:hypothetical protein
MGEAGIIVSSFFIWLAEFGHVRDAFKEGMIRYLLVTTRPVNGTAI